MSRRRRRRIIPTQRQAKKDGIKLLFYIALFLIAWPFFLIYWAVKFIVVPLFKWVLSKTRNDAEEREHRRDVEEAQDSDRTYRRELYIRRIEVLQNSIREFEEKIS